MLHNTDGKAISSIIETQNFFDKWTLKQKSTLNAMDGEWGNELEGERWTIGVFLECFSNSHHITLQISKFCNKLHKSKVEYYNVEYRSVMYTNVE